MHTPHPMTAGAPGQGAGPRPGTLASGVGLIVVAALCGLGSLVLILAGGREMLRGVLDDILRTELGVTTGSGGLRGSLVETALDEAYRTLSSRAYLFAFVAAVFLILAALIWGRRNWARIVFTVFAPVGIALWALDLADYGVTSLHILDGIAVAATVLALVTIWLGPSNRAVKAAKAARGHGR